MLSVYLLKDGSDAPTILFKRLVLDPGKQRLLAYTKVCIYE